MPLWPPVLATRAPGSASSLHAHHALHLMVCTRGALRVRWSSRGRWLDAPGLVTAPDVPHAVQAERAEILLVFVDPESAAGSALAAVLTGSIRLLLEREAAMLRRGEPREIMGQGGSSWIDGVVAALGGPAAPVRPPPSARVRSVLAVLRSAPPDADTSLAALAAAVGWSPGRLMHAFTESIGIPLRPYQAWLRLQRSAAAIVAGVTLADAAHGAGFSDAAHMARTFRRMLGITPSALRPEQS